MMISATPGQKLLIDGRRHTTQCKHPKAQDMDALECLFCKRCGISFIDGKLEFLEIQLEEQDPPGEYHASSYAGTDKNKRVLSEVLHVAIKDMKG